MRSSPKRRKALGRAGLALLGMLALLATATVAWGHGATTATGDRVHACVLSLGPLRLPRVVTETEACLPLVETGLDLPQNGTLIGADIGTPVTNTFTAAPDTRFGPITVTCPGAPLHFIVGATISHSTDASLSTSVMTSPTAWAVQLIAPTGGAKTITVAPICMRVFVQS